MQFATDKEVTADICGGILHYLNLTVGEILARTSLGVRNLGGVDSCGVGASLVKRRAS